MKLTFPVLIGDIGGTNARFAIVGDAHGEARSFKPVRLKDHATIEDAIQAAVLDQVSLWPASMMLAIATPLVGERFRLTNADWTIDPESIMARFGFGEIVLMNDFAAQGLAALALKQEYLHPIGTAGIVDGAPKVVIGPGTGLGIANVVRVGGRWAVIPGEGGHIDIGPRTDREMDIWRFLRKEGGRVSLENAVSGRGLENLYQAICKLEKREMIAANAEAISLNARNGDDPCALEAAQLFLTLLARVAGDMGLLTLAYGGIYLAGGIAAKMLPLIPEDRFRTEFENKAPHRDIMAAIPLNVMTHPVAALEGLAESVRHPDGFSLEGATRQFSKAG